MLPHHDLKPAYDRAVWLWVCRTWRDDEADREAARIHDRFGVTSWPHLFVIDPRDDRVLLQAGRSVEAVADAILEGAARVTPIEDAEARMTAAAEARALTLDVEGWTRGEEASDTPARRTEAAALLEHADVVVRVTALRWLLPREFDAVLPHAASLLVEGGDAARFALLDELAKRTAPALSSVLARLVTEAGTAVPSGNPNVLRMRAAACLLTSGDAMAIEALAPIARAAEARNVTTRTVVAALGAIAERGDADARKQVVEVLSDAWPAGVEATEGDAAAAAGVRYALRLVDAVTQALQRAGALPEPPSLPSGWSPDEAAAWRRTIAARLAATR